MRQSRGRRDKGLEGKKQRWREGREVETESEVKDIEEMKKRRTKQERERETGITVATYSIHDISSL